ncbi:MAG: GPR endopeptidase [Clostridia bacterium]|nr:GPR endopeptidase [Clostridia bacterium]
MPKKEFLKSAATKKFYSRHFPVPARGCPAPCCKSTLKYFRSDLAAEWIDEQQPLPAGIRFEEGLLEGFSHGVLTVENDDAGKLFGRAKGRYETLQVGKLWLADERGCRRASKAISQRLFALLCELIKQSKGEDAALSEDMTVLVAGLGNRRMTADALGPMVVERITVTRHVKLLDPPLFERLSHRSVAALAPGVLGDTGMESAETIKALISTVHPDLILAVDALAAGSSERLATTVQLSTAGIAPGSGVGNDRPAFTKAQLGVPVLALGVPTVVDSSTLVEEVLQKAGLHEQLTARPALSSLLDNGRSFFVSLKEADAAMEALSTVIANAIDSALSI